ncbi:globin [Corynebacterium sp. UBA2622]|uniref:globin n=1 Tax=Corynebacterium sp. UBA2622 TaxID=1946393 RepID=UPI0025C0E3AB|nr:globin [Corynebacterium sp. UBA2622]
MNLPLSPRETGGGEPHPSVYDALGEEFFRDLVHGFYEQVKVDDLLGPMYPSDDWEGAENRLRWFLVQYWGGPHTFQQERGRPMLRKRHFPFSIGEPEAERWLQLMERSLDQFDEHRLPGPARAQLWNHMQRVAYMMINRQ